MTLSPGSEHTHPNRAYTSETRCQDLYLSVEMTLSPGSVHTHPNIAYTSKTCCQDLYVCRNDPLTRVWTHPP